MQDILRLLFGKDVKDVDVDMVVKKRNECMADRGKKVLQGVLHIVTHCMCVYAACTCDVRFGPSQLSCLGTCTSVVEHSV